MKNIVIVALLLTISSFGQVDASKAHKAEKILAELVQTHKAVGAVAGVLEIDQFMWSSAQGHMDFKMKTKINTETLIRTASIAKSMQPRRSIKHTSRAYRKSIIHQAWKDITRQHKLTADCEGDIEVILHTR